MWLSCIHTVLMINSESERTTQEIYLFCCLQENEMLDEH